MILSAIHNAVCEYDVSDSVVNDMILSAIHNEFTPTANQVGVVNDMILSAIHNTKSIPLSSYRLLMI